MASNKIRMPSSQGGLVSYSGDYESKIVFKPGYVVAIAVIIIVLLLLMHIFKNALFGI